MSSCSLSTTSGSFNEKQITDTMKILKTSAGRNMKVLFFSALTLLLLFVLVISRPANALQEQQTSQSYTGGALADEAYVSMAATKMNVIYAGLENPVSVAVAGVKAKNVIVTSNDAAVRGENGLYFVSVSEGTPSVTLTAEVKSGRKTEKVGSVTFRVRSLPKPILSLGAITGSLVSPDQMREAKVLRATMPGGFEFDGISFTVNKFSFMYVPKKGVPVNVSVNGDVINETLLGLYDRLAPDDQVIFYDVRAMGPKGEVILPSSLLLTIRK